MLKVMRWSWGLREELDPWVPDPSPVLSPQQPNNDFFYMVVIV